MILVELLNRNLCSTLRVSQQLIFANSHLAPWKAVQIYDTIQSLVCSMRDRYKAFLMPIALLLNIKAYSFMLIFFCDYQIKSRTDLLERLYLQLY